MISHQVEKDGEIVVQIPIGNVSSSDNIEMITRDGTSDTNDTPVYVEVEVKSNSSERKRKREIEKSDNKEEEKKNKVIKYVGETNRSGYERGREHMEQFKRMEEGSHILKHYLKYHRDLNMEEIKIGMRIRSTFRSAIERQISEAVAIYREEQVNSYN